MRSAPSGSPYLPPQFHRFNPGGYLTAASPEPALDIAVAYLNAHAAELGLTPTDLTSYTVTTNYVTENTGTTHLSFRQTLNGLEVINVTCS